LEHLVEAVQERPGAVEAVRPDCYLNLEAKPGHVEGADGCAATFQLVCCQAELHRIAVLEGGVESGEHHGRVAEKEVEQVVQLALLKEIAECGEHVHVK